MRFMPLVLLLAAQCVVELGCGARTSLESPVSTGMFDVATQYRDAASDVQFDDLAVPFPIEQCGAQELGGIRFGEDACSYGGARWGPEYIYLDTSRDGLDGVFLADGEEPVNPDERARLPDGGLRFPPIALRLRRTSGNRFELVRGQSAHLYWPNHLDGVMYHDVHFLRGEAWLDQGLIRFESEIRVDVDASSPARVIEDCLRYIGHPCRRPRMPGRDI